MRLEYPAFLAQARRRWETRNPGTYFEKVRYKMARDRRGILVEFADKLTAREYVAERVGREVLVDLLAVGTRAADIPWQTLPRAYVAKVNHGSNGFVIVNESAHTESHLPDPSTEPGWSAYHVHRDSTDPAALQALFDYWLGIPYQWYAGNYREWAYHQVSRRVLVEAFVGTDGNPARNFKVFCFHGTPATAVASSLDADFVEHADSDRFIFDLDAADRLRAAETVGIEVAEIDACLEMCAILSAETDYVRIDWLVTPEGLKFGEFTNYPNAGQDGALPSHRTIAPEAIRLYETSLWSVPRRYRHRSPYPERVQRDI